MAGAAAFVSIAAACSDLKVADSLAAASLDAGDGGSGVSDGESGLSSDADAEDDANVPTEDVCTDKTCTVDTIEKGLYGPVSLAVDGTHLYWIEVGAIPPGSFGQLVRISKASGCSMRSCYDVIDGTVFTGQLSGELIYEAHLALGPNNVCYTQSFNANAKHAIACFALADPVLNKRSLDDGDGAVTDLWVGGSEARWAIASSNTGVADGSIMGRSLNMSAATKGYATKRVGATSVTSDGSSVFWSEFGEASSQGSIDTVDPTDGGVKTLAGQRENPYAVRIYGPYLYWIEGAKKAVMRGRVDGTGVPEQIATTDYNPIDLAVDATGVYWIASGQGSSGVNGSLSHAPLTPNGKMTIMIQNINLVYALAVDGQYVYIASVGQQIADGQIVRIKKTK